jgi:4,5-DOPA dioxygenase extradiol
MTKMPALFVSHGSPELALRKTAAHRFLAGLARELPKPKAILVASAHWQTSTPRVATGERPETVYDFGGFDPRLRQITYPAPGATDVAHRAIALLAAAGLGAGADDRRGRDHGVWVPLVLMYPEADVPVTQVSIQPHQGPAHHEALGRALAPLREEGVLVLASGAITHNLGEMQRDALGAQAPRWVAEFADWMHEKLEAGDRAALLDYRRLAPHAARNHPEDDHLLPLYVALGAARDGEPVRRVHSSLEHGVLAMDVYRFGEHSISG